MVINTNVAALSAPSHLLDSQAMLAKALPWLSTGSKITSPADDAAGLAVASRLDSTLKRADAAKSNVANAVSFTPAINQLSNDRASIGAYQARLNFTADELTVSKENLAAASSGIQDVDVADEATQYARYNILVQSGTAMLAQANAMPQSVLKLLQ